MLLCACSASQKSGHTYTIRDKTGTRYRAMHMPDGKDWTTQNINTNLPGSFCYDNVESNCNKYGRLYLWKTAHAACSQLGKGWRLPTRDDWKALAKHYGGVFDDSNDEGKGAYIALTNEGSSQFNILLGGGKDQDDTYKRIEAHGFYWTSTETSDSLAWFGNFGKGRPAFFLQNDGEKDRAFSVRCVKTQ